jgi:hypothetical protein
MNISLKMENIKILFHTGPFDGTGKEGAHLTKKMRDKLQEYNYDPTFFTDNKECALELKRLNIEIIYIPDEMKKIKVKNVFLELSQLEQKYQFNAQKILFGDTDYSSIDYKKSMEDMVKYFYVLDTIISKDNFDFVYSCGNKMMGLVSEVIVKGKDKPIYVGITAAIFSNCFTLSNDNYGRFNLMDYYFNQEKIELNDKEEKDVKKVIANFKSEAITSTLSLEELYKPTLSINKVKYFFDRLKISFIEKDTPYLNVSRGLKKYLLRLIRTNLLRFGFYEKCKNKHFFYFPLQTFDDTTGRVWCNHIESRLSMIKLVARALPANCLLYTKEHPAEIGSTSLKILREIKKIPNVRLLHYAESNKKLILKSKGVITLAGTTGMESIFLGKPVILFGRSYYDFPSLVTKVNDYEKLDETLREIYNYPKKTNEKKAIHLLRALRKSSHECLFAMKQYFYSNEIDNSKVLSDENMSEYAKGIVKLSKLMKTVKSEKT